MQETELTRRAFVTRASAAAAVVAAAPLVRGLSFAAPAYAADVSIVDGTLQAFFDTLIPGRKVAVTHTGQAIHPKAILGLDPEPGAVEADALALAHNPGIGFDVLSVPFLAELEVNALLFGGDFLTLDHKGRENATAAGLRFDNPLRLVWEAAAAVAFAAFCGVQSKTQTAAAAPGYAVMGLPGAAPNGYRDFSYKRKLSRERTKRGYLA